MRWWMFTGYGLSIVVHMGLATGIGSIPKTRPRKVSVVKVFDAKPAKKKAEDEKKPPPVESKPKPPPPPKNTPPPAPTSAAPPPTPQAAMAALPDFGISLSGGEGGIAVPVAGLMAASGAAANAGPRAAGGPVPEKRVKAAAPKPSDAADGCVEEPTKPKAIDKPKVPWEGTAAHAAGVEGVIKVEFRVGADGEVVDARVLQGLGHGLDELVIATAKRWKFGPATRCGKPVESRHIVNMRFALGD